MRFGLAKNSITPLCPTKIACAGNFADDFTSIHDDVFVRCLVMDDGKNKALFVSFDLLFHSRELNDALADYAHISYGVKHSEVVVSYTHAHTAPAVKGYNPGHHTDEYEQYIIERAKECIDKAMLSLVDGYLTYGSYDTDLNVSRRKIVNGICDMLPNPDRERDTQTFVMCIRDTEDNVRGIFVNYGCHPVFYPHKTTVSAEFPGRVCQLLDEKYSGCISMYTQSAAGDVRPIDTVTKDEDGELKWKYGFDFADVDKFAKKIADGVVSFIDSDQLKKTELNIKSDEFEINADVNKAPIEHFCKLYDEFKEYPHNPTTVNCNAIINGAYDNLPEYITIHCSSLRLSKDLYVATIGGEPCYNVKKIVKSAFGDKELCFIGYTDSCAYIVDDDIINEGGYEPESFPEYGIAGPFKLGISDLFYNGFLTSIKRINDTEKLK